MEPISKCFTYGLRNYRNVAYSSLGLNQLSKDGILVKDRQGI